MRHIWIVLTACAVAGCENPEGQTDRFLAEATKNGYAGSPYAVAARFWSSSGP